MRKINQFLLLSPFEFQTKVASKIQKKYSKWEVRTTGAYQYNYIVTNLNLGRISVSAFLYTKTCLKQPLKNRKKQRS